MRAASRALEIAQLAVFAGLGLSALRHWRRRHDAPAAWIAATFGILGLIVLVAQFLPERPSGTFEETLVKLLVAVLVLFPYCLFRFVETLVRISRPTRIAADAMTVVLVAITLVLPEIPSAGEPRGAGFEAYILFLAAQWTFLSAVVAVRLWRAGAGQPTIARRRMRTLAAGAIGLASLIVVGAAAPAGTEPDARRIVTQIVGLLSAPLFLLGFSPPGIVLAVWRRREERALREAEVGLMKAESPAEVTAALLPRITALVGARAAAMYDREGRVVGAHGVAIEEAEDLGRRTRDRSEGIGADRVLLTHLEAGRLAVVTSQVSPYFGEEELEMMRALGAFADLALARARLIERERHSVEAMRDFVAIASHDLRTPVTILKGLSSTMLTHWERLTPEQVKDFVRKADRHADHLSRLVEELLLVSKLEAGVLEPNPRPVDIRALVDVVLGAIEGGSRVSVTIPEGLEVVADADHLQRIVTNLVTNAFRYGGEPVALEVRDSDGFLTLAVSDRGAGVPKDFEPHLFEKFARADPKTSRSTEGTGLGLSIVRGLAVASGGRAWYEPNRPTGAVFGVRIPARPEGAGTG